MSSAGLVAFQLGFQVSPIILTGGVATGILGGMLPIISITESADFLTGLLSGGNVPTDPNQYFAQFEPVPGSTLIDNQFGTYPFANQSVAANAVIVQPLKISMLMKCPANTNSGYAGKLATMTALQQVLAQHTQMGGTYTVVTVSQIYTNMLLQQLRDVGGSDTKQRQTTYQWDFFAPLITLQQATSAQNNLMNAISNGTPTDGSTSGPSSSVGSQNSLATGSTIPAASSTPGVATTNSAFGPVSASTNSFSQFGPSNAPSFSQSPL